MKRTVYALLYVALMVQTNNCFYSGPQAGNVPEKPLPTDLRPIFNYFAQYGRLPLRNPEWSNIVVTVVPVVHTVSIKQSFWCVFEDDKPKVEYRKVEYLILSDANNNNRALSVIPLSELKQRLIQHSNNQALADKLEAHIKQQTN